MSTFWPKPVDFPWLRLLARSVKAASDDSAQALVETALSLIGAFTLAFMLFEGAMLVYSYSVINDAAREGIRYAIVHGSDSTNCSGPSSGCTDGSAANVVSVVKQYAALSFHDISGMTVTVNYPDATQAQPLSLVSVTINYTYVPFTTLVSLNSSLSVTSEGRIVY